MYNMASRVYMYHINFSLCQDIENIQTLSDLADYMTTDRNVFQLDPSSYDVIADLTEDMAAEQKARATYDNILRLSDDPDVNNVIRFLREYGIDAFLQGAFGIIARNYYIQIELLGETPGFADAAFARVGMETVQDFVRFFNAFFHNNDPLGL